MVRLPACGFPAGRGAAREGPRLRRSGGCLRGRRPCQGRLQAGEPWFHLRRQPVGHDGGAHDHRYDQGRRPARQRRARRRGHSPRAERRLRRRRRHRGARHGPHARHGARPALRGSRARSARCRPRHQRDGGQRGAHAAAAGHERGGGSHGGRAARAARAALPGEARRRLVVPAKAPLRHFLQFEDFSREEHEYVFARTRAIKDKFKRYERYWPLEDRTLAMIFEKPSTRTRMSFESGMHQLGGAAIYLYTRDSQLGRGEPVEDAAQVISRMCDVIMVRTFEQDIIERFARNSRMPVINGLTDEYHPCQLLADIYTFIEHRGAIGGRTVAWIGDSNNVCNTWLQAAAIFDFKLHISTPPGYEVEPERMNRNAEAFEDPMHAAKGAHLVTTDVWTSMGFEAENEERKRDFQDWQVDEEMMKAAGKGALFMHCLPAHRGEEVAAQVIDGPQSVVWDEAENRLHTQKALLEFLVLGRVQ